jgi:hypothetical protein
MIEWCMHCIGMNVEGGWKPQQQQQQRAAGNFRVCCSHAASCMQFYAVAHDVVLCGGG